MKRSRQPQGFILVLVLFVIMLASMVAASLLFSLGAEQNASTAGVNGEQARAVALSGVYQAMKVLAAAEPGATDWQDNAGVFRDQLVLDDGAFKWYFSVYSVCDTDPSGVRFGLTDEAAKLNVKRADPAQLETLPNLAAPVAQAIAAFLNATDAVPASASSPSANLAVGDTNAPDSSASFDPNALDFASSLSTNSPDLTSPASFLTVPSHALSCVDDLLHVPGFTAPMLYGEDANFNGRLDPNEDDGDASWPPDNQDGKLDLGLWQSLTVCTYDLNVDNDGKPRLSLNDTNTDLSSLNLPPAFTDYLDALHRNHILLTNVADLLEASQTFTNGPASKMTLSSGIGKTELPVLLDRCTTTNQNRLVGLVNVLTAPAAVLAALPGVDQALAEAMVSAREGLNSESRKTPAWLYQEGVVNADTFKKIAPYLTTRSRQFHFQVVAYPLPAGPFCVWEVVIDMAAQPPAILSLRDLSKAGLPFAVTGPDQSGAPKSDTSARRRPKGNRQTALHRGRSGISRWRTAPTRSTNPTVAPPVFFAHFLRSGPSLPHPSPLPLGEGESTAAPGRGGTYGFLGAPPQVLPLPAGEGRGEGESALIPLAGADFLRAD